MHKTKFQDARGIDAAEVAVELPQNVGGAVIPSDGGNSRRGKRWNSARLRKPPERDESPVATAGSKSPAQAEVMRQARADLEHGLQDTDCRGQAAMPDTACSAPAKPVAPAKRAPRRTPIGAGGATTRRGAPARFTGTRYGRAR